MDIIRYIVGAIFLLIGMLIFLIEVYGIFHLKFSLNRMHSTALGDTLGITLSLIGIMVFSGLNFTTLKIALIVLFLWFTSPVASHLIAKLELTTYEDIEKQASVYDDLKVLEDELASENVGCDTLGDGEEVNE